ncbi:hypothetical protein KVV02_003199 [Mortierella alpina]|uniref:Adhesin domain-containing protein n=1 Tax=Mortierella alpina TaxID=64518 RepID=A0A9P8CVH8_MORAP|nr:hypothetical protein KVV02_003199 [Mortierella alpina]
MPFPADKKDNKQASGHIVDAVTPEQEREMFGRQSPYASSNGHSTTGAPSAASPSSAYAGPPSVYAAPPSVHAAPPSVYAAPPSARPSSAAPAASSPLPAANPQTQDRESPVQSHGPQAAAAAAAIDTPSVDEPPPSYEEVACSRAPQTQYGDTQDQEAYTSPSVPLLGGNPTSGYSSIPIPPPPRPSSPSPSSISVPGSDRARRFNKFWLLFFVVIVVLLLMDDGDPSGGEDECSRRPRYTKNLFEVAMSPNLDDFEVNISNMVGLVTVEQAPQGDPSPFTRLHVEVSALQRDDLDGIQFGAREESGNTCFVTLSYSERSTVDCLRTTVKIVVPANATTLKRLKTSISEGNLTISLLDSLQSQPIRIQELDTRVITGHINIRANVISWARLGGSVGTIAGKIIVGKDLQVNMVNGGVALDLAQSRETKVMDAKVEVMNGSAKVNMVTPYEGEFKVETNNGWAKVDPDPGRTHFSSFSSKSIKGWNSVKDKDPGSSASTLRLLARNGDVELSLARVEL